MRVRFAPSPTGFLHLGNVRSALFNWLFARQQGAEFILRIDDTDRARSEKRFEKAITEDLVWLGLTWDALFRQSERLSLYADAAERLKTAGRLYPCYETQEELEAMRKLQRSRGNPPIYNRAGLHASDAERQRWEKEGRRPHWRFLLEGEDVLWDDLMRGECHYNTAHLSDPVLVHEGGGASYMLASVVDDIDLGVTDILRGSDHITNTVVQIQIFRILSRTLPRFGHLPLISDSTGEKFSKRTGSACVRDLREAGVLPLSIAGVLCSLGASRVIVPTTLKNLVDAFDIGGYATANPRLDPAEFLAMNAKIFHAASCDQVNAWLAAEGMALVLPVLWSIIRENVSVLADIAYWQQVCMGKIEHEIVSESWFPVALEELPSGPWNEETWATWTGRIREKTGVKGAALFKPLRLALTGRTHGPEMKLLLPLMNPSCVRERLR